MWARLGALSLRQTVLLLAVHLPAQATPPATGTAEGRVLGPLGEPMIGIEVRAAIHPALDITVAKTRTDGQGMFVLGRLPAQTVTLMATVPGHTLAVGSVSLSVDRPGDVVQLRLWPANTLRGRVVDTDGTPVTGAVVLGTRDFTWFDGRFRSPEMQTDADGRFELAGVPIGDCVLRVWAPGFVMQEQSLVALTDQEVDVQLARGDGDVVSVRVTGLPLEACANSRIRVYPTRGGSGFAMPRQLQDGGLDAQGTWSLRGLPAAEWNVEPTVPGFVLEPRSVRTEQGKLPRELVFVASAIGSLQLRGVLHSAAGKPLAGQKLICRTKRSQSMNGGTPGEAVSDADGRFVMDAPLVKDEPYSLHLVGSSWVLRQEKTERMTGSGDLRYRVRYEDRAEPGRELRLIAVEAAHVTAKLVDHEGLPVPFLWTELQQVRGGGNPDWSDLGYATSRRDGTLQFAGVHGGEAGLRVVANGSGGAGVSETFTVAPGGRHEVTVTLQRAGRVIGRVLDKGGAPVAGYRVSLGNYDVATGQQTDGGWNTVPTGRDGRFAFVGVAPGGHKVHAIHGETRPCDSEVFEVGAGATVELDLRLGDEK
ncbi:MAG: carboxypeptidase regulatory-like domain-containing protein [Planctomycetes bacterium]|nr:carboxypeptidase regulatory-like domain-containing protein [Planctomycetota bacterium]